MHYTDCSSCLHDNECGWCNNPEEGVNECVDGGSYFAGCPNDKWLH
jgi:hypothetical protein